MDTSSQGHAVLRTLLLLLVALQVMPSGSPAFAESVVTQRPGDLFVLRLIEPNRSGSAAGGSLILQAYGPYDFAPIEGLELSILFETDGGERREVLTTDARGEAIVPVDLDDGSGPDSEGGLSDGGLSDVDITVSATHRGVTRTVETTLWRGRDPEVLLSTDRRLYQPGQVVHLRGLWLDGVGRPLRGYEVELKIVDPEDRVVVEVDRTTSELGIASFDWKVPAAARTGDYRIESEPGGWRSEGEFRIHPYEPARLLVEGRARHPFFLPGELAEVEVLVTLPDGTPLPGVRVDMAQASRRDQGCSGRPEVVAIQRTEPRDTDAQGRALLELGLEEDFAGLRWRDWKDLDFEVRAEDPLTGRSESQPLVLRISRHPVHLSLLGVLRQESLPTELWVLAQDAAGEPKAGVAVELLRVVGENSFESLERVVTNRLGIAPIETRAIDEDDDLRLVALEGGRLIGSTEPYLWLDEAPLALEVERPLRQAGEPLDLILHASRDLGSVRIEIASEGRLLASRTIEAHEGALGVSFPYRDDFEGPLAISVLSLDPRLGEDNDLSHGEALVIYPGALRRRLELSSDRSAYRPGEVARLSLEHAGAEGPSAVALAVVDRASEARQASEGLGLGPSLLMETKGLGRGSSWWVDALDPWRGTTLEALDRLAPAERQGDEAQQAARALLADFTSSWPEEELDHPFHLTPSELRGLLGTEGRALRRVLDTFEKELNPRIVDDASLRAELEARGVDLSTLRDPWGQPYHFEVSVGWRHQQVFVRSSGWDAEHGTRDDLEVASASWPFAERLGDPLVGAAARLYRQEGRFMTSVDDVARALAAEGIDWWSERDPWGTPYRLRWSFDWRFELDLISAGPDGRWSGEPGEGDDVVAWTVPYQPSTHLQEWLRSILSHTAWDHGFDGDDVALRRRLEDQGVDPDRWLDPWGRPLYFRVQQRQLVGAREGREGNADFFVELRTVGADGRRGTEDDRPLTSATRRIRRPEDPGLATEAASTISELAKVGKGLLSGQILLCDGYPIPGITVVVTPAGEALGAKGWTAITDESGRFEMLLPADTYQVVAELEGMQDIVLLRVLVEAGRRTPLDLVMDVATQEETIIVSAESPQSPGPELTDRSGRSAPRSAPTPRLRQDFRETLFWLAEGRTDAEGRLEVEVPLADNLTRWSVAALASDQAGRLSTAEHELVVRQPFSVEPDLPPLLTAGDRLAVPVVINNATGGPLSVELAVRETESGAADDPGLVIEVPKGVMRHDIPRSFPTPGEHGLRLVASAVQSEGETVGDAVWKTTRVASDGAHRHRTFNRLLSGGGAIELEVPRGALEGSGKVEVVVYEDFEEHLLDTLDGLAEKPVGCAEQTTSTAWANLLLLERLLASGEPHSEAGLLALRHLEIAVEALRDFQRDDGGFGFWQGSETSSAALTAYVVDFLLRVEALGERSWTTDSGEVSTLHVDALASDAAWVSRAAAFLANWPRQHEALWPAGLVLPEDTSRRRQHSFRTLALVARSLARHSEAHGSETSRRAATEALGLLAKEFPRGAQGADPYILALELHTHLTLENVGLAVAVARQLRGLATRQQDGLFWDASGATPFWGWRRSARLETTALVVEGLLALGEELGGGGTSSTETDPFAAVIRGGLSYLLLEKGRSGLWTSTQTTLRVLHALDLALPPKSEEDPTDLRLMLGGEILGDRFRVEGEGESRRWIAPLGRGKQRLEVSSATSPIGESTWRLIQVRTRYVVPWKHPKAEKRSELLDFAVDCGPTRLDVGEQAVCQVEVARRQWSGGMVIAEIGLPPGAEVDRAALLELQHQGVIQRYESWPGRAVLYLWPHEEPIRFELPWHPRLAFHGKAQPSRLWDYYSPDEEVLLKPAKFRIGELP